jgi:hypothetical protein
MSENYLDLNRTRWEVLVYSDLVAQVMVMVALIGAMVS